MNTLDNAMRELFLEVLQSPEAGAAITKHVADCLQQNRGRNENYGSNNSSKIEEFPEDNVHEQLYNEVKAEAERLGKMVVAKQTAIDEMQLTLEDKTKIISRMQMELVEKQAEINDLRVKNHQLAEELLQSNKSVEELKQLHQIELQAKDDIYDHKDGEIVARDKALREKDNKIAQLERDISDWEGMYNNLLDEIDMYKDRNDVLECEKDQLFDELTKLQERTDEKLGKGWRFNDDYAKLLNQVENEDDLAENEPLAEETTIEKEENAEDEKENKEAVTEGVPKKVYTLMTE